MPHLAAVDPITGEPVRRRHSGIRYEHPRPGDLLHVDVKKLGRVPDGGGWRLHGREEGVRGRGIGYDYLHVAVDDHSRVAYIEALPDERDATCAGFLHCALTWFREHGVVVLRGPDRQRQGLPRRAQLARGLCRTRHPTPVHQARLPLDFGKAERLNRTLLTEFAYARPWLSTPSAVPRGRPGARPPS